MRAASEMLAHLLTPAHQHLRLFVSCFEIYGGAPRLHAARCSSLSAAAAAAAQPRPPPAGKLYDLLNGRKLLTAREGRKRELCIVSLREYEVQDGAVVQGLIQHAAESRTTGSTGASPLCPLTCPPTVRPPVRPPLTNLPSSSLSLTAPGVEVMRPDWNLPVMLLSGCQAGTPALQAVTLRGRLGGFSDHRRW